MLVAFFCIVSVAMIISITIGIHMIFSCIPYLPHDFQLVKRRLLKGIMKVRGGHTTVL